LRTQRTALHELLNGWQEPCIKRTRVHAEVYGDNDIDSDSDGRRAQDQ